MRFDKFPEGDEERRIWAISVAAEIIPDRWSAGDPFGHGRSGDNHRSATEVIASAKVILKYVTDGK